MKKKSIIFFDGECNICNSSVQWILKHDKYNQFLFESLQSNVAKNLLGDGCKNLDTLIYVRNNNHYFQSTAVIYILYDIGGIWKLAYLGFLIPPFLRNKLYAYFAKNRTKWFGKYTNQCTIHSSIASKEAKN